WLPTSLPPPQSTATEYNAGSWLPPGRGTGPWHHGAVAGIARPGKTVPMARATTATHMAVRCRARSMRPITLALGALGCVWISHHELQTRGVTDTSPEAMKWTACLPALLLPHLEEASLHATMAVVARCCRVRRERGA
ncbi:uncharacterized protein Tco025E_00434, partial [Trypanosoma conorhini]